MTSFKAEALPGFGHLFPHGEGDVFDSVVYFRATSISKLWQCGCCRRHADHALEIRDRDEERSIGISVSKDCVNGERGVAGAIGVDEHAVVDDPLKHRVGQNSHSALLRGVKVAR